MRLTSMSKLWFLLGLLASQPWPAYAAGGDRGSPCYDACQMTFRPTRFNDTGAKLPFRQELCSSRLAHTSLYLCLALNCNAEERVVGLNAQNSTCQLSRNATLPPFHIIVDSYTDDEVSRLRRLDKAEAESGLVLMEVVVPSERYFGLAFDTLAAWGYVFGLHILYGWGLFVFWTVVVVIGMLFRFLPAVLRGFARSTRPDLAYTPLREVRDDGLPGLDKAQDRPFAPLVWLKRFVTVPATFGYRTAQPFGWYTVPPRVQTLTIAVFIVMNVVFCVHGYRVFQDNMYWPETFHQWWRYVSDRTGIISFANFPLIWLFGMRNNLLMWLTGWDFGTYNNFHRWVARVSTVQAIVHSVGYTVLVVDAGGWAGFAAYWEQLYWWTGEIATVSMCALLVLSLYWMRRHMYETFLVLHIVLSLTILVTMLGHVSIFNGQYNGILWVSCFIWVLDRLLRILRIVSFNPKFWNTKAEVSYDPDSNIIRLEIPKAASTSLYRHEPGAFYYIYVLSDSHFWESHPFTMASSHTRCESGTEPTHLRPSSAVSNVATALLQPTFSASSHDIAEDSTTRSFSNTMTFLIRPYDGFTERLRNTAIVAGPQPASLRILVEGPYGHTQPFHRFENIVFVVGGSGIAVPLAYLETLCQSSQTQSIRIIWAARQAVFVDDVLKRDFGGFVRHEKLSIEIYVTREEHSEDGGQLDEDSTTGVHIHYGRPDIGGGVESAVQDATFGSLAVVASGPSSMSDDVRRAVVEALKTWNRPIEYFQESFNW